MKRKTLFALLSVLICVSCGNFLPEPHALKYNDKEFNETASFILGQRDIREMDDFTRYYKSINNIAVKLENVDGNENAKLLSSVTDSLKLDPEIVSALRLRLEQSNLRRFVRSSDTILFIVDGFLDDSWGFMYAKKALLMDSTSFAFKGHSVKFVEDINSNWKRTAIH